MESSCNDPVIQNFLKELQAQLGLALKEVWLFGSRARGDADADSDYDVVVVAEGEEANNKKIVQEIEWHCMENYNALVSCLVYSREKWERCKKTPLGFNILHEGLRTA